jgi:hypothetical protein
VIVLIDTLLKPTEGTPAAGGVLRELWEKDELGMDWLGAFSQTLQEEATARRRPTSPRTTSA